MTWTRLHDACQHQKSSTVVKLAHACAEEALMVDDHGSTPLHIACWGNPPVDVIQALLDACPQTVADQDVDGNNPLHIAASHPEMSVEVIRALLEACPVAVSAKNKEGLMPLHMACRNAPRNEPVIAVLIEAYPQALETRTKVGGKWLSMDVVMIRNCYSHCCLLVLLRCRWVTWSSDAHPPTILTTATRIPTCISYLIWLRSPIWN